MKSSYRNLACTLTLCCAWPIAAHAAHAAPAAPQGAGPVVSRLAVIDLEANGVPAELSRALTESVATKADRTGVFETVSPVQLAAVVALDKSRWAMGGCSDEACFARLAEAVNAEHALGGSVAKSGDTYALQLVLVEVETAKALGRIQRSSTEPSDLIELASEATVILLQPILTERSGYANVTTNVDGAQLTIDGELSAVRPGQVFQLAAGPHVVKGARDGFYSSSVDLSVRPEQVSAVQLTLVPSPETVRAYESDANLMRTAAWATAGLTVVAGVAAAFFYSETTNNLNEVKDYNALLDIDRAQVSAPTEAHSNAELNQGLYLSLLGTAVVSGLASAGLFAFGPDPDRYSEFDSLAAESEAR